MLPRDMLETLYRRFAADNPNGTVIVCGDYHTGHIPAGMSKEEASRLEDEGKLYQDITIGGTRLGELMPELTQPEVLARLAGSLELDPVLLSHAARDGAVPFASAGRHPAGRRNGWFMSRPTARTRIATPAADRLDISQRQPSPWHTK